MKRIVTILLFLFYCLISSVASVRLPSIFADGMVLQRDVPVTIWGKATPWEVVAVSITPVIDASVTARNEAVSSKSTKVTNTADENGCWEVTLPPQEAGTGYSLTVNDVVINDVAFGDVWLCSGQSNMETPLPRLMLPYGDEIKSYSNTLIRYVKIPTSYNFHAPQDDTPSAPWLPLTVENASSYSALPYFFAKEMFERTGSVPVGIINASVGGTPIEAWLSEKSIADNPLLMNDKRICEDDEWVAAVNRTAGIPQRRWYEVLTAQDEGINGAVRWDAVDYKDDDWDTTDLFDNSWGLNGRAPFYGSVWFRKYIYVESPTEATLYMGRIEGADSMFVNGKFVGNVTYSYPPRIYALPTGTLRKGRNLLTVRVQCSGGMASFVPDKPYKIIFSDGKEISLEGAWKYRRGASMPAPPSGGGIAFQNKPTGLYNGMIAPLQKFNFKGVIWYQGEANADRWQEYGERLTALIDDWRGLLGAETPFLLVQLPNYMKPSDYQANSNWAALRNVQLQVAQKTPHAGMAVAIDIGEWNDIHPLNKKDLGKRLALQATKHVYDKDLVCDGPVYESKVIKGRKIVLTFRAGTDSLESVSPLKGFVIAGADGRFVPANAEVQGRQVVVWNDAVANPLNVRYAWADNPLGANLRNTAGLPASPFKTDD
ncbi:MAG: sialate O-acetylesterase [Tannerella sp.]|jgi:sialate O-acetylesterase|nr:sialate O-acetylesterase [Tannerella sp.]